MVELGDVRDRYEIHKHLERAHVDTGFGLDFDVSGLVIDISELLGVLERIGRIKVVIRHLLREIIKLGEFR